MAFDAFGEQHASLDEFFAARWPARVQLPDPLAIPARHGLAFRGLAGLRRHHPVASVHKINGGDVYNVRMSAANMADIARPSSLHPGGVNVGYADGHVVFVTDSIDYRIYQAIMTPNTRSSDMPMNQHVLDSDAI